MHVSIPMPPPFKCCTISFRSFALLMCFFVHCKADVSDVRDLPNPGRTQFREFLEDMKTAVDAKPLTVRPIEFVFGEGSHILDCDGLWAEFGVFTGKTLTLAAHWRAKYCGPHAPPVYGFDTFTGLPEDWQKSAQDSERGRVRDLGAGAFSLDGALPSVPPNTRLVKGLFSDTLPSFLAEWQRNVSAKAQLQPAASMHDQGRARRRHRYSPGDVAEAGSRVKASYIHVDCDLYASTRDALLYLSPLIQPGTVLVFDELINYPRFAEHEVKALWEWLVSSGLRVRVIGGFGPLEGVSHTMDMAPVVEHGKLPYMNVALLVV
jgi:hypothetical protein